MIIVIPVTDPAGPRPAPRFPAARLGWAQLALTKPEWKEWEIVITRPSSVTMKRRAFVWLNRTTNAAVRVLGLKRFRGGDLLYLTTTGRFSGRQRTTPLLRYDEPTGWVVVASNGGADWEPGWWLNLRAGAPAAVRIGHQVTPVVGAEVVGEKREALWRTINENVFDYESYQRKVRRQIAVVRLQPVQ